MDKTILISEVQIVSDPKKVEEIFEEAVSRGLEGIMAKKLDGAYQAGARGWNWIKYKKSYSTKLEDTIDAVVMGYDLGQGKRQGFGIGAFLIGIYNPEKDVFETVSKIGTGLTDMEWKDLEVKCQKFRLRPAKQDFRLRQGFGGQVGGQAKVKNLPKRYSVDMAMKCDVWVEPQIVVEINADEITRSPVHTAGRIMKSSKSGSTEVIETPGYALRFPRLKQFRDKQPEDATTLAEIEAMYKRQRA